MTLAKSEFPSKNRRARVCLIIRRNVCFSSHQTEMGLSQHMALQGQGGVGERSVLVHRSLNESKQC